MDTSIKINVNLSTYPIEAIYGASYVFIDRAYIFLDMKGKDNLEVSFKAKEGIAKKQFNELEGEFLNELLNYALRVSLAKTNKKIRERIVERALYSSVGEDDLWDEEDDSMDIATPWEEKK